MVVRSGGILKMKVKIATIVDKTELLKKRQINYRLQQLDTARERITFLNFMKKDLSNSGTIVTETNFYEKRLKWLNYQINTNTNIIDEEEHFFNNYL